jgi:hypothetical protein
MPSSSSTSSFEFNRLERAPRRKVPWAAVGALVAIVTLEATLHKQRVWYADSASWFWDTKQQLVEQGKLEGEVALVGTSVLFHAADPKLINDHSESSRRVVNLALNGMVLQHQAQMLARCFERGQRYDLVILELRSADLVRDSWRRGPYFQFWASWSELLQSGVQFRQPGVLVTFAANRLLGSFGYRKSLDNWISTSARQQRLAPTFLERNGHIARELDEHLGFCEANFGPALTSQDKLEDKPRTWSVNSAGELWLRRLLALCQQNEVKVAILQPPAPPFVEATRAKAGFRVDFHAYVRRLQEEFPGLAIDVIEPTGYDLDDFVDDHHFSEKGGQKLSADLAAWLPQHTKENKPRDLNGQLNLSVSRTSRDATLPSQVLRAIDGHAQARVENDIE